MLKKEFVVPGAVVKVIRDDKHGISSMFILNSYCALTAPGTQKQLFNGEQLKVLSKPRRKDGINLVKVKLEDETIGEVFYCDLHDRCEIVGTNV